MKLLSIFFIGFLFSCAVTEKDELATTENTPQKKKDSVIIADTGQVLPMKKIKIQVYYTSSYCGGAPPNKEILAEFHKKRWFQNSGIRICSNRGYSYCLSTKTNNEGIAEIELNYGNYSVLLDTNLDEQMSHLFDIKCMVVLDKKWKQFSVTEKGLNGQETEELVVVFDFECDPCDPSIKMRP